MSGLKTTDIANMLADMLAGVVGGEKAHWLELIGPVKMLPIATNIHCNWSASPIATGEELTAITKAIELVRKEHPYVIG